MLDRTVPVGVTGAGAMGAGIAQVAVAAGHQVRLYDVRVGAAGKAVEEVRGRLSRLAERGRLDAAEAAAAAGRLTSVDTLDDLAGCGLVVEAVVEDLEVKRELLAALERVCGPSTVLATNTSSLSVTALAARLERPQRVLGMHFFNPAPLLPLVEVVSGAATGDAVASTVAELARGWGKTPVRCASTPGFIVNRVARPFYGEAMRLLEDRVADAATVDAVLREAGGFAMGPCELTDLIGQDVNHEVGRSVWEQTFHDPRYQPSLVQQRLVDAGWLGRKSGRGFYDYSAGAPRPEPATEPPRPAPERVTYYGGSPTIEGLLARAASAGVTVEHTSFGWSAHEPVGLRLPSGGRLVECTGRTAQASVSGPDEAVAVLDWVSDPSTATRVALAISDSGSEALRDEAVGLLQAAGAAVSVVADAAGLIVARTVSMLANEAIDVVARAEASATDVDVAMRLGTSYPFGPYEWGVRHAPEVVHVLDRLAAAYPSGRYRPSPLLRRLAADPR